MDKPKAGTFAALRAAMGEVRSAHAAVALGVATHAQKHEAMLDARRAKAEHDAAIQAGTERATGQV